MYNGTPKHKVFIGFNNPCSRADTYITLTSRRPDVTKLCSCLHTLLLITSFFGAAQKVYTYSKKAVHQQHVNCLINTRDFAG